MIRSLHQVLFSTLCYARAISVMLPLCISSVLLAGEYSPYHSYGFTENKGQVLNEKGEKVEGVYYSYRGEGSSVYLTEEGLSYVFVSGDSTDFRMERIDMILQGASIRPENIIASGMVGEGVYNFYYDQQRIEGVKTYNKIVVKNIYPKIDWVLYVDEAKRVKYDFIAGVGADASLIAINYQGQAGLTLNSEKNVIHIKAGLGEVYEGKLVCTQEGKEIVSRYDLDGSTVRFKTTGVDLTRPLIIDPPLFWSTYFGGKERDRVREMTCDSKGNVFIVGGTYWATTLLPTKNPGGGAYFVDTLTKINSPWSGFIAKFNNGGTLIWSTFFIGQSNSEPYAIDVDKNDNIYVGGTAIKGLPVTPFGVSSYQKLVPTNNGRDGFVSRFSNNGNLEWCTYYGGDGNALFQTDIYSLDVDGSGNVFITGITGADDLPIVSPGAGAYTYSTGPNNYGCAFVAGFNSSLGLDWSTYYQGGFWGVDVKADNAGNIYITGWSETNGLVLKNLPGAYNQAYGGTEDVYIAKFNPAKQMLWSTYFGGTGAEKGHSMVFDAADNLYLTGMSGGFATFPTMNPGGGAYFQAAMGGVGSDYDAFISKFSPGGILLWSTYYGGDRVDVLGYGRLLYNDIDLDAAGNIYLVGYTESIVFPTKNDMQPLTYFDGIHNGTQDGYIAIFGKNLDLKYSTLFGGSKDDYCVAVNTDHKGCFFVSGTTYSTNMTTKDAGGGAYYQNKLNQDKDPTNGDVFMLKFCSTDPLLTIIKTDPLCSGSNDGKAIARVTNGTTPYTFAWSPAGGTDSIAQNLAPGTYTVTVTDNSGKIVIDSVTISSPPDIAISKISPITICPGDSATLSVTVTGGTSPYAYNWNSGASVASTYKVKPPSSATYTIEVTDKNGCKKKDSIEVIIGPPIAVTVTPDTSLCEGDKLQLMAGGGTTYSWLPATGLSNASIFNPIATPTVNTTYTVTVGSGSCPPIIDSVKVTVNPVPSASVLPVSAICKGQSVQLSASGGDNYAWTPTASLDNAAIASPMASPTTTTMYTLIVSNTYGCRDTMLQTLTVNDLPVVSITGDTVICSGDSTQLTATGADNYTWSPNLYISSAVISAPKVSPPAGTVKYVVTGTDSNGCSSKDSVNVTVAASITANAGSDTTICNGSSVTLGASGGTTYSWSPSGSLSNAAISNPVASPSTTTTYTVTVSSGSCAPAVDSIKVIVTSGSVSFITPDTVICYGDALQLQVMGGKQYQWSPASGLNNDTIANPIAVPASTTVYTVTVTDNNCAPSVLTVTVNVETLFINAGFPQNLCYGDSVQLSATLIPGATYVWGPSASLNNPYMPGPYASPTVSTTYTVTVSKGKCVSVDSMAITYIPKIIPVPFPDQFICPGDKVQLGASGGTYYYWSPSDSLSDPNIADPYASPIVTTSYEVEISDGNCPPAKDTVVVYVVSFITADAGNDTVICLGDTVLLKASGGTRYKWSTGDTTALAGVAPASTTTYSVYVSSGTCLPDTDEVTVTVINSGGSAGADVSISKGSTTTLNASGGGTYVWTPSTSLSGTTMANPLAGPTVTTTYTVTITSPQGCVYVDSVKVEVTEGCEDVYLPNAFTPNNDGLNDVLFVRGDCIKSMKLVIYDRWGEKVFETEDQTEGWDGIYEGKAMDAAVYDYHLNVTQTNDEQVDIRGNIHLVR